MNTGLISILFILGIIFFGVYFVKEKTLIRNLLLTAGLGISFAIFLKTYSAVGNPISGVGSYEYNYQNYQPFENGHVYVTTFKALDDSIYYFKIKEILKDNKQNVFKEIFSTKNILPDTAVYLYTKFVQIDKKEALGILNLNLNPEQIKVYLKK